MNSSVLPASDPVAGLDIYGRSTPISLETVLAVVPDRDQPARTRLHLASRVVLIQGAFEDWMQTPADRGNDARTELFDPTAIGLQPVALRWDAASGPAQARAA